jgi:hypothetical protein
VTACASDLLRLAGRLGELAAGSPAADRAIHEALSQAGPVLAYTADEATARRLLPAGYEATLMTLAAGRAYYAVRQPNAPYHGAWGATAALSLCAALLRLQATTPA